jgi:ribosomal protein L2
MISKISFLSALPNKNIKYIKSSGSAGTLTQLNLLNHTAVVKLPSGIKKIFSLYTIATIGAVSLSLKKNFSNTKSGY